MANEKLREILNQPIDWVKGMKHPNEGINYYLTEPFQDKLADQILPLIHPTIPNEKLGEWVLADIKLILYKHTETLQCGYAGIRCDENHSGDDNYTVIAKELLSLIQPHREAGKANIKVIVRKNEMKCPRCGKGLHIVYLWKGHYRCNKCGHQWTIKPSL